MSDCDPVGLKIIEALKCRGENWPESFQSFYKVLLLQGIMMGDAFVALETFLWILCCLWWTWLLSVFLWDSPPASCAQPSGQPGLECSCSFWKTI